MSIQVYDYEQLDIMSKRLPNINVQNKNINRLYLSWKNTAGHQCKMIGPQTKCFCNHRFKQHEHINPVNGKSSCKDKTCKCKTFQYIPTHGAYDFKCLCKHSYREHDRNTKKCQKQNCTNCTGFASTWTCSCGKKYSEHESVSQTFEERKRQGKSTNDMNRMVSQLQGNMNEGSLYRPIKSDRQSKLKKYSESFNHNNISGSFSLKNVQNQQVQEIEEIYFKKSPLQRKN